MTGSRGALSWFRRPGPDEPGRLNAVYQLLDHRVVTGHADDVALLVEGREVTLARLLEDAAAVGGILRAQAVGPGTPVAWRAAADRDGATALLALARVGGVLDPAADLAVDDAGVGDAPWDVVLKAGRTDPAPVAELAPDDPWTATETVGSLAERLVGLDLPLTPAALVAVLHGPTIEG